MTQLEAHRLRDLVVAISLSNICFLNPLRLQLTTAFTAHNLYALHLPTPASQIALMLDILILGVVFWLLIRGASRFAGDSGTALVYLILLAALCLPAAVFLRQMQGLVDVPVASFAHYHLGPWGALAVVLVCTLPAIGLYVRYHRIIIGIYRGALLVVSPFVLIVFAQLFWSVATYESRASTPGPPLLPERPAARFVWIVAPQGSWTVV